MKTLKYFVAFLAAALMFSACEPEQGLSQQNKDKAKPTVSLLPTEAYDVTLSFDIVASENASQYAYAVFTGSDNDIPTAYDILIQETFAVADGAFNTKIGDDAAFSTSVTIDCSNFPAETYQVFAAVITDTGLVGEVTVLDVTMDDKTVPAVAGADADANVLTLEFTESVVRGNGKAYVSVIAWGVMQFYINEQTIADENITIDGNLVTIVCPEAGNGAGYMVSFEEGFVCDLAGNKCPALKTGLNQDLSYAGLGWDADWVNFPILESYFETPAEDTDWSAEDASITFKFPFKVIDAGLQNPIQVLYREDAGESQLNAEYVLAEDAQTVTVYIPRMPEGEFDVRVAEAAFYDIWGNDNAAFSPTTYRYTNFLSAPVVGGAMVIDYVYPDGGDIIPSSFNAYLNVIDRNNVILQADWFEAFGSIQALPMLVGTVNYDTHEIVFDGRHYVQGTVYSGAFGELFYYYDQAKTMGLVFMGGGEEGYDPVVMKFDDNGYVTSITTCGYVVVSMTDGEMLGIFGVTEEDSAVTYPQQNAKVTSTTPRLSYYREVELKLNK
ncbi:MAG: hypothetical protein IKU36_01305 [Bacteroidales bacterium]|nr:hypothetical protein [Bacteroidales bacterium]